MDGIPAYLKEQWPTERQFERRHLEGAVKLIAAAGAVSRGWCRDVSEGGIGATIAAELRAGEEVRLEFQLPVPPKPLQVRAVVRYSSKFYHGFEFITLSPEQRQLIRLYLGSQSQARQGKTSVLLRSGASLVI